MVVEVVSVTVALIALIGTITGIVIVMVICNIKRKAKKNRDGLHPDSILESRYRIKDQELDVEGCPISGISLLVGGITPLKWCVLLHFKFNTLVCNTAVAMTTFDVLLWQPLMFTVLNLKCK